MKGFVSSLICNVQAVKILNKQERQNQIILAIKQGHKVKASELAQQFNVSVRTITRDMAELEAKGVQLYTSKGKRGGYEIHNNEGSIQLNLNEQQIIALFLTLIESKSYSTLPYSESIETIINQCLTLSNVRLRHSLRHMNDFIKFEDTQDITLPKLFADILIYSNERHVMLIDFQEDNKFIAENVIFIGLLCRNGIWLAIIYEIGSGRTRELPVLDIYDISYSFEKTIKTYDITIHNYTDFLNPAE